MAVRQAHGSGQIYNEGQLDISQPGAVVPTGSNVNVYIGVDYRNVVFGITGEYFNGLIDEVAIYHSALTPLNVSTLYSEVSGGRVFTVYPGATVTLTGLTIASGVAPTGGGIYNGGTLTIVDSTLSGDAAVSTPVGSIGSIGEGGAIYNATGGILTVTGSAFLNDSALGAAGSSGGGRGGAIFNASGARVYLANDTFNDNAASVPGAGAGVALPGYGAFGGAIDNYGTAYIVGTTIARSKINAGAPAYTFGTIVDGSGIENETGASLDLLNTIVAIGIGGNDVGNQGTVAGDNNLVMTSDGLPAGVVALTANPQFEPLAYKGGTTPTLALTPGSPAIGAGNVSASLPTIPTGLADWWKAEGNTLDIVGGATGTIQGSAGAVTYAPGIAGQAFQFNGTNGYIAVPSSADVVGTGAFTVSAWIKTGSDGLIIQQRDASNFNGEYVLAVIGGRLNFWDFGNSQYGFNITSNRTVADNNWHYIVAVRQVNGLGQVYIDGQLDSSQNGPVVPVGSGINVYIGADYRNIYFGDAPEYFKGLIDEVEIYHSALAAGDVQTGYVLGASQTQAAYDASAAPAAINGLVGWWTGNGNTVDSTGRDPGVTSGAVTYGPGVSGQAFQLNGAGGGNVSISDSPALDSSSFSFGGWFELTQAPAAGGEVYLASKYNGNYNGWILRVGSSLVPTLSLLASASRNTNVVSSQSLTLNKWYYISATYDGTIANRASAHL